MLQSCQAAFRLMQELERRVIPEESLNNNQHMSIINIISNDELTLVQGVNGLFFCEESWVTQSRAVSRIGKVLPKEIIGTKDQSTYIRRLTELNLVAKSMKRLISKSNCFSYRASRLQRAARFASEQNKLLFSFDALTSNPS